ncbi:MAG: ATP-binding cassette domain-containing protein, partial [Ferruginibacter sp.]
MHLLEVSNVSKINQDNTVVYDLSFTQEQGENIAIAGETGSGKTTILKLIGGLLQPNEGTIIFQGKKVLGSAHQLIPGEAGTGYLSQYFELWNNYYIHEILSYAGKIEEKDMEKICRICRIENFMQRTTAELSGGERQRVALA